MFFIFFIVCQHHVCYSKYCVESTLSKITHHKNGGFRVAIELDAVMQFIANDADRESFDLLNLRLD